MQLITLGIAAALTLSGAALMTQSPEDVLPPDAAKPITLIGCVQTGAAPASFVLASATRAPELTLGAPARPDASAEKAVKPAERVTRYQLVVDGQDLTRFVGHKVEATGAVTTARSATERPESARPTLFTATAVKEVSAAC